MAKTLTGPASKNTVSGGTQFPLKQKDNVTGGLGNFTNAPGNTQSDFMRTRMPGGSFSTNVESGITGQKLR